MSEPRTINVLVRLLSAALLAIIVFGSYHPNAFASERRISMEDYREKMKAGWVGQIVGVCWGAPTEFKYGDRIIPEDNVPQWSPEMLNGAFDQDDLYVEMTFLRTLEQHGFDVSLRQAGIDFANSNYPLWCANAAGRANLRKGIAPPDSGHPKFNPRSNDIDYQIEADFSGLIAPGMPNLPIAMGEKFGRIMNYGDGVYAGQFVGAMYTEAFFETDPVKIVSEALKAIPTESQYAEMVRDMLRWSQEVPRWEDCWQLCQEKYRQNPDYQKASNGGIDCRINGAYVLMGLLYGGGDIERTTVISCRCGQDSDCNPSSAAGVLCTSMGFSNLPERFTKGLDEERLFNHTAYHFPALLDACEKLAREAVVRNGGRIETSDDCKESLIIPNKPTNPSPLLLSWEPGPIESSRYTDQEMAILTYNQPSVELMSDVERFAHGWNIHSCGDGMPTGWMDEAFGKKGVLATHPLDRNTPCVLSKKVCLPLKRSNLLLLTVGHHPQGDWELIVKADMKELYRVSVDTTNAPDGWINATVDLTPYSGETILLELLNQPTGWSFEAAYWAKIQIGIE